MWGVNLRCLQKSGHSEAEAVLSVKGQKRKKSTPWPKTQKRNFSVSVWLLVKNKGSDLRRRNHRPMPCMGLLSKIILPTRSGNSKCIVFDMKQ